MCKVYSKMGLFTNNAIVNSASLLLSRNTHRLSETTSGLGVLTTDLQVPVVTQTTVRTIITNPTLLLPHLLQTVQILTEVGLQVVGDNLLVLAGLHILLSVQEPLGDVVLQRVGNDSNQSVDLLVAQLSGTTP